MNQRPLHLSKPDHAVGRGRSLRVQSEDIEIADIVADNRRPLVVILNREIDVVDPQILGMAAEETVGRQPAEHLGRGISAFLFRDRAF